LNFGVWILGFLRKKCEGLIFAREKIARNPKNTPLGKYLAKRCKNRLQLELDGDIIKSETRDGQSSEDADSAERTET